MKYSPSPLLGSAALFGLCAAPVLARTPPVVSAPPAQAESPAALPVVPDNYRLSTEDTINIEVLRHADVSRTFRIPADGRVRMVRLDAPLLVEGKTCQEVASELTRRLQSEGKLRLAPTQVTVSVIAMRPRRVYVRGNAITGREMDLKNGWRITELVAEMGGVPQPDRVTAKLQNVNPLVRPEPITVDLAQALNHPASPANIVLKEGDTLVLQAPQMKRIVIKGTGPLGSHEMDERLGLRTTMEFLGYSTAGATGDLRGATLWHYSVPGDPASPLVSTPVDLYKLLNDRNSPDYTYTDLDTLEIPISKRFVSVEGATASGSKKIYLPEDRKSYLSDVMAQTGTAGNAKIGNIEVRHHDDEGNETGRQTYNLGKYISNGDLKQNPLMQAGDVVYVPTVKRTDPNAVASGVFTGWGLFNIFKALVPGVR